jgi:hypothetical protein
MHTTRIDGVTDWRSPTWSPDVPSRPGWLVSCDTCGPLGLVVKQGDGTTVHWAYNRRGDASRVGTMHKRRHGG